MQSVFCGTLHGKDFWHASNQRVSRAPQPGAERQNAFPVTTRVLRRCSSYVITIAVSTMTTILFFFNKAEKGKSMGRSEVAGGGKLKDVVFLSQLK